MMNGMFPVVVEVVEEQVIRQGVVGLVEAAKAAKEVLEVVELLED